MLMAHPTVLRNLVARYERLHAQAGGDRAGGTAEDTHGAEGVDPRVRQQLLDTVYTLCVSTGTREIGAALAAARERIAAADLAADASPDEDAA